MQIEGGSTHDVTIPGQASRPANESSRQGLPLLANNDEFIARWTAIQTTFVDEPRKAVEQADTLVAEVMREVARVFAEERARLDGEWSRGTDVSTRGPAPGAAALSGLLPSAAARLNSPQIHLVSRPLPDGRPRGVDRQAFANIDDRAEGAIEPRLEER